MLCSPPRGGVGRGLRGADGRLGCRAQMICCDLRLGSVHTMDVPRGKAHQKGAASPGGDALTKCAETSFYSLGSCGAQVKADGKAWSAGVIRGSGDAALARSGGLISAVNGSNERCWRPHSEDEPEWSARTIRPLKFASGISTAPKTSCARCRSGGLAGCPLCLHASEPSQRWSLRRARPG